MGRRDGQDKFNIPVPNSPDSKNAVDELRSSEEKFRRLFELESDAILLVDNDTERILEANAAASVLYGYTRDELLTMRNIAVSAEPEQTRKAMKEGWIRIPIRYHRKKDGTVFPVEISASYFEWEGRAVHIAAIRDITERKRAEEALQESEERFRSAFENANVGMCLVDTEGRIFRANRQMCRIFGYSRTELESMTVNDIAHPEYRDLSPEYIQRATSGEAEHAEFEKMYFHKQGRVVWGRVSSSLVRDRRGNPLYFISHVQDITERKRAEEELRALSSRQQALLSAIPDIIMEVDAKKVYTWANQAGLEFFGEDVIGMKADFYFEGDQNTYKTVQPLFNGDESVVYLESWQRRRDGEKRLLGWWCRVLKDEQGTVAGALSSARDITQSKQDEIALRESEEKLEEAQRIARMGRWELDLSSNRLQWSEGIFEMFEVDPGKFDASYEAFLEAVHPEDRDRVHAGYIESVRNRTPYQITHRLQMKDGRVKWVNEICRTDYHPNGEPLRSVGIVQDITEIKKAEEEKEKLQVELIHAQKMEALGRLAGGVAHDFNNMVGIIIGHTELAGAQIPPDDPIRTHLKGILQAAHRSSELVRQLLAFARKQVIRPNVLDLNEAVEGILNMLSRLLGEDITLNWIPGKDPWSVRMDPSQVHQILSNLLVNSRDAMPKGGRIAIESSNVVLNRSYRREGAGAAPGEYVLLAVSDTGCGMSRELMEKIFDPFFTTKEVGRGTGLGLATVYGIVNQNKGFIEVSSEPDRGTTFTIYLPAFHAEPVERTPQPQEEKRPPQGRETVLLVEDEEALLEINKIFLKGLGYVVLAALTPVEALMIAERYAGEIQAVITDVIMPDMNGRELVEKLRAVRPTIRSLFMSGYTANVIAQHGVLDEGVSFIEKPFSLRALAEKLREVLGKET